MTNKADPPLRHLLHLLYFAAAAPLLYFSAADLLVEWDAASRGESTDPAQHVAMAMEMSWCAPLVLACFLAAMVTSIPVWRAGSRGQRLRIASWYGALAAMILLPVNSAQFPVRAYFSLYETVLTLPLALLPVVWMFLDGWRTANAGPEVLWREKKEAGNEAPGRAGRARRGAGDQ